MLWNNTLNCGIPAIDQQHQKLFRQVDILLDNRNRERIPETLEFLGEYVIKHFSTEEAMHARTRYPEASGHMRLHADFVRTYRELKKEYAESGHALATQMKINKMTVAWLREHIMGHYKDFAHYYKALE